MAHPGTRHHSNKLSEQAVRDIRATPRSITNKALGKMHGVSGVAVWKVRSGKTWKHLK